MSHSVVSCVVVIVPDAGEAGFTRLGCGPGETLRVFTHVQKVDEIFDLSQPLWGQLLDLFEQDLIGCVHGNGIDDKMMTGFFLRIQGYDGGQLAGNCQSAQNVTGDDSTIDPGSRRLHPHPDGPGATQHS